MNRRTVTAIVGVGLIVLVLLMVALSRKDSHQNADAAGRKPVRPPRTTTTTFPPPPVTVPITTTTTVAPGACSGVAVTSGLQAAIDGHTTGTTFCLSGSFSGTVAPKSGDVLAGPATIHGAVVNPATGVTLRDLTVDATGQAVGVKTGQNWTLERVDVSKANIGIDVNSGLIVHGGSTHDNGQYGFVGGPVSDVLIDGLECAHNNTLLLDPAWDAGCSKIHGYQSGWQGSERITFKNMAVHDNYGPGLWCDWACATVTYDHNHVYANAGVGIFHEVSFAATITNNTVTRNCTAFAGKSVWYCAEILVTEGHDVTVSGNTVDATTNGIGGVDTSRADLSTPEGQGFLCSVGLSANTVTAPGTPVGWVSGTPTLCAGAVWTTNGTVVGHL